MTPEEPDVVVVGGGLAGATLGLHLARAGHEVVILERSPSPRWRACGVFSATAMRRVAGLGLLPGELPRLARPIDSLRLIAPGGSSTRLTYGGAAGFSRPELDAAVLRLASNAGADVRVCTTATEIVVDEAQRGKPAISFRHASGSGILRPRVVVGADGIRSVVARSVGVDRSPSIAPAIGLSYHVSEPSPAPRSRPATATMLAFSGGYCGLAPVPGGRVNVGIVLDPRRWSPRLRASGAKGVAAQIVAAVAVDAGGRDQLPFARSAVPLDPVAGAFPLGHAVSRAAAPGWLLVGDAAGFLDPFTGEGLGRAFETAELGAEAVAAWLHGTGDALDRYAAEVRERYVSRDRLTRLVAQFLARPRLFDYATRRLAGRTQLRETLQGVLAERVPADEALDPRFLLALLRP